jgi:hypothetical protein
MLIDGLRQGDERPVVVTESLRAGAGRESLPRLFRQSGGDAVGPLDAETGRNVMRTGNGEDVAEAVAA